MKKKTLVILAAIAVIGGTGIAGILQLSASPASANLSKEEVLEKAKTQFPGEVVEFELEDEGSKKVYEVEIEGTDRTYDLTLDADSGDIINLEEKAANPTADTKKNSNTSTTNDDSDDQTNAKKENKSDQTAANSNNAPISEQKATEIALAEVNGKITELELDEEDGHLHYEIEVHTEKNEVDIDIDAYTGKVLAVSYDDKDDENDSDD